MNSNDCRQAIFYSDVGNAGEEITRCRTCGTMRNNPCRLASAQPASATVTPSADPIAMNQPPELVATREELRAIRSKLAQLHDHVKTVDAAYNGTTPLFNQVRACLIPSARAADYTGLTQPKNPNEASIDFRSQFADAYKSLSVAAFSTPFWNQSMGVLLTSIESEIELRVGERIAAERAALAASVELPHPLRKVYERPHGLQELFYYTAEHMQEYGDRRAELVRREAHAATLDLGLAKVTIDQLQSRLKQADTRNCELEAAIERPEPVGDHLELQQLIEHLRRDAAGGLNATAHELDKAADWLEHFAQHCDPEHAATQARNAVNAERWNEVLLKVGVKETRYAGFPHHIFGLDAVEVPPSVNLMRGSVGGHFTKIIDDLRAARAANAAAPTGGK